MPTLNNLNDKFILQNWNNCPQHPPGLRPPPKAKEHLYTAAKLNEVENDLQQAETLLQHLVRDRKVTHVRLLLDRLREAHTLLDVAISTTGLEIATLMTIQATAELQLSRKRVQSSDERQKP